MNAAWRTAIAAACLILVWRVVEVNLVLYDDAGHPTYPARDSTRPVSDLDLLRQAVRENPANAAAYTMLALGLEANGDSAGAARAHQSAREVAPVNEDGLAAMADFL